MKDYASEIAWREDTRRPTIGKKLAHLFGVTLGSGCPYGGEATGTAVIEWVSCLLRGKSGASARESGGTTAEAAAVVSRTTKVTAVSPYRFTRYTELAVVRIIIRSAYKIV